MKIYYKKRKNQRIKSRFRGAYIELKSENSWRDEIIICRGKVFFRSEQEELQKQGKPNLFSSTFYNRKYFSDNFLPGKTIKSLIRKIKKIKDFLPDGIKIRLTSRYVGYDAWTIIKNPKPVKENHEFFLRDSYSQLSEENEPFDNLVKKIRENGYIASVTKEDNDYWFCLFYGNNLKGGFCTLNEISYSYLDNKVAVDHYDLFDKWSKCALNLPIPTNDKEMKYLLDQLQYLNTEEGYEKNKIFELSITEY